MAPPFVLIALAPLSDRGEARLTRTMTRLAALLGNVVEGASYERPMSHLAAVGACMTAWRVREFRSLASHLAREEDALVVYSPPARTTAGLRRYYVTARDSLQTAVEFHRIGPRCIPLASLALDRTILTIPRSEQVAFVKRVFGGALGPPVERAARNVETVRAILLEGGAQSAPARALYLHRHGLAYRRAGITALAGRDPAVAESRPAFFLATRILELGWAWLPPLGHEQWST
jgi:sugar diacid utilization regulator